MIDRPVSINNCWSNGLTNVLPAFGSVAVHGALVALLLWPVGYRHVGNTHLSSSAISMLMFPPVASTTSIQHRNEDLAAPNLPPLVEVPFSDLPALAADSKDTHGLFLRWDNEQAPDDVRKWREAVRRAVSESWNPTFEFAVNAHCRIALIQATDGRVIGARVSTCDADDAVRDALISTLYRATLPPYPGARTVNPQEIYFEIGR